MRYRRNAEKIVLEPSKPELVGHGPRIRRRRLRGSFVARVNASFGVSDGRAKALDLVQSRVDDERRLVGGGHPFRDFARIESLKRIPQLSKQR
jgi:hypothetical protein